MSVVHANGVDIHYEVQGSGPWLTFSHALAGDLTLWDSQVKALAPYFTLLRYDTRGHGGSSTPPAPYVFPDLVQDVIGLWDALGVEHSHFVGLSMGGMVGQQLAVTAPERLDKLVLCSTSSSFAANREGVARLWEQRIAEVRSNGMAAVVDATLARWFTEPYRYANREQMERVARVMEATSPEGYAACGRMVAGFDLTGALAAIRASTLVLVGEDDAGTPPAVAEIIANAIPNARFEVFPQASHCLNIEQGSLFNLMLKAFLER